MLKLVFLAILVHAWAGQEFIYRIYEGSEAGTDQFPYVCKVSKDSNSFVSACTILRETWVITAAHCIPENANAADFSVYTESVRAKYGTKNEIARFVRHPDFSPENRTADLLLIELKAKITFTGLAKPIKVKRSPEPAGRDVLTAGWGITKAGDTKPTDKLQYTTLKTITNEECLKTWSNIYNSHICAIDTSKKSGICMRDAGGPLVDVDLVGITTYSRGECGDGKPSVFTRLEAFKKWIDRTVTSGNS